MLWLALHFPSLPLEIFTRGADTPGPQVAAGGGNRPLVVCCNRPAAQTGIHPGIAVSAAHALAPGLTVHTRDMRREHEMLERLAAWTLQFTPTVSVTPPGSVLLEIGGSLRLFGGLPRLLAQARSGLADLGFEALVAVAPTPAGAALLACAGLELELADLAALRAHLSALSIDLLAQEPAVLKALERIGVRTLGECRRLPRDGLARRFGAGLLDELDRAFGDRADPRPQWTPPELCAAKLDLPSPVWEVEAMLFGAKRLLAEITGVLAARQSGITQLAVRLDHAGRAPTVVTLSLSLPSRDPAHLLALLRERFGKIKLPDRVESIALTAAETMQLAPRNFTFFADREQLAENRIALVERLRARLGAEAVCGLVLVPDHRPELAWRPQRESWMTARAGMSSTNATTEPDLPLRPLWLLPEPRPLRTSADGATPEALSILSGPERIESGWWDGNDVTRDYFVARDTSGARLWIFWERGRGGRWFLHGVFA